MTADAAARAETFLTSTDGIDHPVAPTDDVSVSMGIVVGDAAPSTLQALHESRARMKSCYGAGLKKNPLLSGRLFPLITIDVDGKVAVEKLGASINDPGVVECVLSVLQKTTFPKPTVLVR